MSGGQEVYSEALGAALSRARTASEGHHLARLGDLRSGTSPVTFRARVVESEWREVSRRKDGVKVVLFSGLLSDGSAQVRFTWWDEPKRDLLLAGSTFRFIGAEVRDWQGRPEVRLTRNTRFESLKAEEVPMPARERGDRAMLLWQVKGGPPAFPARVTGVITSLLSSTGVVHRCPECSRVLQANVCGTHGTVEGKIDLRLRAVLDDGTGTVTVSIRRPDVERIVGRPISDAELGAQPSTILSETLHSHLVGHYFRLEGRLLNGEFPTLLVESYEPVPALPAKRLAELRRHLAREVLP